MREPSFPPSPEEQDRAREAYDRQTLALAIMLAFEPSDRALAGWDQSHPGWVHLQHLALRDLPEDPED